jgi:VanZ family protein
MSSIPDRSYLGVDSATEQVLSNLAHIPAFTFLAFILLKTFNANGDRLFSHFWILSGLFLFAISTELLQSFIPGRTSSFMDLGLNAIGILIGFLIIRLFGENAF